MKLKNKKKMKVRTCMKYKKKQYKAKEKKKILDTRFQNKEGDDCTIDSTSHLQAKQRKDFGICLRKIKYEENQIHPKTQIRIKNKNQQIILNNNRKTCGI